jgi:hypothetical protein
VWRGLGINISRKFNINPERMQFVGFTPRETNGKNNEYVIAAACDALESTWQEGLALFPRIEPLDPAL